MLNVAVTLEDQDRTQKNEGIGHRDNDMLNKRLEGPGPTASALPWKLRMLGFTTPVCVAGPRRCECSSLSVKENAVHTTELQKERATQSHNTHALATTVLIAGEGIQREAPGRLESSGNGSI